MLYYFGEFFILFLQITLYNTYFTLLEFTFTSVFIRPFEAKLHHKTSRNVYVANLTEK